MHSIPWHLPLQKTLTPTKSPIISPDLENGRGSLDFPLIVRDAPDEIPLSARSSKPSLSTESRDSPRIPARQQMTSPDGRSLSNTAWRVKSGRQVDTELTTSPIL